MSVSTTFKTEAAFYEAFDSKGRCIHVGSFHRDSPEWVEAFMAGLKPVDLCGNDDCLGLWYDPEFEVEIYIFI